MLLIEALCILCPLSTIASCEAAISEMLDAMPDQEWNALALACMHSHRAARGTPHKSEPAKQPPLNLESMRFSYLIALLEAARFERSVFLKFLRNYAGSELAYLEFRQTQAVTHAVTGELDWDKALRIVRESYARGAHASELDFHLRNVPVPMPTDIYTEVLSNSQLYPVAVCDAAEAAATGAARKAVRPVSAVATTERWFAFDRY
ncbi:hypothetical protein [Bradyrhizobium elkanii]|uniref:Uncharacterized protein n=1 Tax=Bradyrhizobium elkanii TaxID=29448 RepID=A0A8I1YKK7_BRAEL|nr:hypothetical protein [Bradyrhizobium elkanii]MBP1299771.1 hypothetical protein [Bradyrhizobium elkanii]